MDQPDTQQATVTTAPVERRRAAPLGRMPAQRRAVLVKRFTEEPTVAVALFNSAI
jgi:hypothetical protein